MAANVRMRSYLLTGLVLKARKRFPLYVPVRPLHPGTDLPDDIPAWQWHYSRWTPQMKYALAQYARIAGTENDRLANRLIELDHRLTPRALHIVGQIPHPFFIPSIYGVGGLPPRNPKLSRADSLWTTGHLYYNRARRLMRKGPRGAIAAAHLTTALLNHKQYQGVWDEDAGRFYLKHDHASRIAYSARPYYPTAPLREYYPRSVRDDIGRFTSGKLARHMTKLILPHHWYHHHLNPHIAAALAFGATPEHIFYNTLPWDVAKQLLPHAVPQFADTPHDSVFHRINTLIDRAFGKRIPLAIQLHLPKRPPHPALFYWLVRMSTHPRYETQFAQPVRVRVEARKLVELTPLTILREDMVRPEHVRSMPSPRRLVRHVATTRRSEWAQFAQKQTAPFLPSIPHWVRFLPPKYVTVVHNEAQLAHVAETMANCSANPEHGIPKLLKTGQSLLFHIHTKYGKSVLLVGLTPYVRIQQHVGYNNGRVPHRRHRQLATAIVRIANASTPTQYHVLPEHYRTPTVRPTRTPRRDIPTAS